MLPVTLIGIISLYLITNYLLFVHTVIHNYTYKFILN